ncbi:MAG TPA: helix-turn-helix transcriptional regulator [Acidimicrobiales bacterium]|nr:helix-turn-helix transcriptional regulator [Acidimicrobiales bacterium]
MEIATLIRDARREAGLTQAELAHRSGTSQPTLATYEAGRALPRFDTLERLAKCSGHELVLSLRPQVRRGAVPIAHVATQIRSILDEDGVSGAWRRLLDFVDDFRGSSTAGQRSLVTEDPPCCGDDRLDAAIAGVVDLLCNEAHLVPPVWTEDPSRFSEPWWFVSGLPGFEAMALRDTPVALARHGVFVNEGAFDRV